MALVVLVVKVARAARAASVVPAAMAVWALARPPVFALYIALSLGGALMAGLLFQAWQIV